MKFLEMMRSFDGIWYYIVAFLCIVFIMAIIGFLMERDNKKKEQSNNQGGPEKVIPVVQENITPVVPEVKIIPESRPIIDFTEVNPKIAEPEKIIEPEFLDEVSAPVIPDIILDETPRQEQEEKSPTNMDSPFVLEINSSDFEQSNLVINENKEEK